MNCRTLCLNTDITHLFIVFVPQLICDVLPNVSGCSFPPLSTIFAERASDTRMFRLVLFSGTQSRSAKFSPCNRYDTCILFCPPNTYAISKLKWGIILESEDNINERVPAPLQKVRRAVICNRTYHRCCLKRWKLVLLLTLLSSALLPITFVLTGCLRYHFDGVTCELFQIVNLAPSLIKSLNI